MGSLPDHGGRNSLAHSFRGMVASRPSFRSRIPHASSRYAQYSLQRLPADIRLATWHKRFPHKVQLLTLDFELETLS